LANVDTTLFIALFYWVMVDFLSSDKKKKKKLNKIKDQRHIGGCLSM
jgi:hypothetical protein